MIHIPIFNKGVENALRNSSWPGDKVIADYVQLKGLTHGDYYNIFDLLFFELNCNFGIDDNLNNSVGSYYAYIFKDSELSKNLYFSNIDNASRWLGEHCLQFLRENSREIKEILK
ncbi:hypothetical protein [Mesonia sp.]|uniref:hypothetical protein n=1 Tax=Mesonia sp. TaxID=1960830 RepID=UPI00176ABFB0|nr:hypothetical protein [Mesonia sp.]HIB37961.1 hypothetical protein [Mesonia sp.]HIO26595.1 hypothetical protein [Flavobacteriaceae bacterium]